MQNKIFQQCIWGIIFSFVLLLTGFLAQPALAKSDLAKSELTQSDLVKPALAQPDLAKATKEGWPEHLRFLTGPNGGQWFAMSDPIAAVLSRDIMPTSKRIGGGVENIIHINEKRGDVGFTLSCFMGASDSGEPEYQKFKVDNAILMANVYPQVLYFLVRKDFAEKHKITDVESLLKLKIPLRFASLSPGTASEFILDLLLRYGYNTNFDKLAEQGWQIAFNNYAEAAYNFLEGSIDCFAYTAGTTVPLIKTMEEHAELQILPVSRKVLDLLTAKFKTSTYTIEKGDYKCITTPVQTLGDYTSLVVRKDLPNDLVFAISKSLWENKDYLAGVVEDFGQLDPKTALPSNLPAHPGAVEFWSGLKKLQPLK